MVCWLVMCWLARVALSAGWLDEGGRAGPGSDAKGKTGFNTQGFMGRRCLECDGVYDFQR